MATDGKKRRALTATEWLAVRAEWERTGAPLRELARKWGVATDTIKKKRAMQEWRRDPTSEVERRTVQKVAEKTARKRVEKSQPVGEDEGISTPDQLPQVPEAMTPDEVIEHTAEERAEVILRHQREWAQFDRIRLKAIAVFWKPDIRIRRVTKGDVTIEEEIYDFSRIEMAKKLAETLFIKHKGERASHNLDHNLNTTKAQDIARRDEMIRETFAALTQAARAVRDAQEAEAKTIDVTPKKGERA